MGAMTMILISIMVFGVMSDLKSCNASFGKYHHNGEWTWHEDSIVKCKRAPEFSEHAEICVER